MRIWHHIVLFGLICATSNANATDTSFQQITGDRLQNLFNDKTVISEYHNTTDGIKDFRFTEHHFKNGTTDYIERGQKTEKGRWNIIGGRKICYRYPGNEVFNGTYCFFVYKDGQCYYNYAINAMTLHGPKNRDWWTSRFIIQGEGGTCDAAVG